MPTTVTSKIGVTNSPTTMDYSTLQAWEDACPANLVTDDKIWEGQCYDQGEFTGASLSISGQTVDSTRYVSLKCASGASFKDKSGVRSTALAYSSSNGVAIKTTSGYTSCVTVSTDYTRVDGLQISATGAQSLAYYENASANTHGLVSSCILASNGGGQGCRVSGKITNSLLTYTRATGDGIYLYSTSAEAHGCTIVNTTGSSGDGISTFAYTGSVVKNCAVFGFTTFGGTNATKSYNATDLSSGAGTSSQTSLTFANQFVSSTNDFRAVSTGSLDLNGTPDTTYLSTDISGTTRHATTPTIGAWEYTSSSTDYTDTGSGTITWAGTSDASFALNETDTNGISWAGTGDNLFAYNETDSSGSIWGGTGDSVFAFNVTDTGGVIWDGIGDNSVTGTEIVGIGGSIWGGTGDSQFSLNETDTNGIIWAGTGDTQADYSLTETAGIIWAGAGDAVFSNAIVLTNKSNRINWFVIDDDLRFQVQYVKSGRNDTLQPDAVLTYKLVNQLSRVEITTGSMSLFDAVNASFYAVIPKSILAYPTVSPNEIYELEISIVANGVTTTQRKELLCKLDHINANVPSDFVIGDDLAFRAIGVDGGATTTCTYTLLEELSRTVKASGTMVKYESGNYEAIIGKSLLLDAIEKELYVLQIHTSYEGFVSTISATLVANK